MYTYHVIKLYPTHSQEDMLFNYLAISRKVYNFYLEYRRDVYKEHGKTVTYFDTLLDFTVWRQRMPSLAECPTAIIAETLRRLHLAFQRFFRKSKEGVGYPRFRGASRWNTLGYPVDKRMNSPVHTGRLRVPGMTTGVRCRGLNREIIGRVRGVRIINRAGGWFAYLNVDDGTAPPSKIVPQSVVGIDVGISKFATLSDGTVVDNPRFGRAMDRKIRRLQRKIQRRPKGSRNRRKAVVELQRVFEKARNRRNTFTHTEAKRVVDRFDLVAVEDLNINDMVKSRYARSIMDAAWGMFRKRIECKAENAGKHFAAVIPNGTTQDCSRCGTVVPKTIADRVHDCPHCGLKIDRDLNAALNIRLRAGPPAVRDG